MPKGQPGTKTPRKSRTTGNPPGPPPKFSHPDQMQPLIDAYFAKCDKGKTVEFFDRKKKTVVSVIERIPYTMEMLALALDLNSVSHLNKYMKRTPFVQMLTRAKTKIIGSYSENTMLGVYPHTFTPFLLCNMDKENYQSMNSGTQINIGIGVDLDKRLNQANTLKLANKTVKQLKDTVDTRRDKLMSVTRKGPDGNPELPYV